MQAQKQTDNASVTRTEMREALHITSTELRQAMAQSEDRILSAMANYAERMEGRMSGVEGRLDGVEQRLDGVEQRLGGIDGRLTRVEATMVTKEYLDEKLYDLRGDMVIMTRKVDTKVNTLVRELVQQKSLKPASAQKILANEPLAR